MGTNHRQVQFENFQIITNDLKSQNAQASSYDFSFLYTSQNYSLAVFPLQLPYCTQ